MRRILWLLIAILALVALFVIVGSIRARNFGRPRFVASAPASIPPFTIDHYDFLGDAPFENDTMWLWTLSGRNTHAYRYDLRRSVVTSELFNAGIPELSNRDGSRLLVIGFEGASLESIIAEFINKVLKRPPSNRTEVFWVLDTVDNTAKRVGAVSQLPGTGSTWHVSPDFQRGYTRPTTSFGVSIVLCDLKKASFAIIPARGQPRGWWDDHEVLMEAGTNQFDLLDVNTSTTRPLFNAADFRNVMTASGLSNSPAGFEPVANWNGSNCDFYFGYKDQVRGLQGTNSVLLKASAASSKLSLIYPQFQFRWSGHLDTAGTRYLYQGESGQPGRGGDGAVYLKNLTNGLVTTIVPPDNSGQYSIPLFYGTEVIYTKNRILHRIGQDGSNDVPLLKTTGNNGPFTKSETR